MNSKFFLLLMGCLLSTTLAHAKPARMTSAFEKNWVAGFLAADKGNLGKVQADTCEPSFQSCAEASIEKSGYVYSDCKRVTNDAQDRCAGISIVKSGYVYSDCLKLDAGGRCAAMSIDLSGYIYSDCLKITNDRQDRCAAASIKKSGYVYSDCLNL